MRLESQVWWMAACGLILGAVGVASDANNDEEAQRAYVDELARAARTAGLSVKYDIVDALGETGVTEAYSALAEIEAAGNLDGPLKSRIAVARMKLQRPKQRGGEADAEFLQTVLKSPEAAYWRAMRSWARGELADFGHPGTWSVIETSVDTERDGEYREEQLALLQRRHELSTRGHEGLALGLRDPKLHGWALERLRRAERVLAVTTLAGFVGEVEVRHRAIADPNERTEFTTRWTVPYARALEVLRELGGDAHRSDENIIREMAVPVSRARRAILPVRPQ